MCSHIFFNSSNPRSTLSDFDLDVLHWSRNEPSQVLRPCCPGQEFCQPLGKLTCKTFYTAQLASYNNETSSSSLTHSTLCLLRCTGWDPWLVVPWALSCTTSCCSPVCAAFPRGSPHWRAPGPQRPRASRRPGESPSSSRHRPYKPGEEDWLSDPHPSSPPQPPSICTLSSILSPLSISAHIPPPYPASTHANTDAPPPTTNTPS